MDLNFTDEQHLLRETVRGICQRHAGLDVVRQLEDDPVGYPEKFWTALGETGLHDMSELSMLPASSKRIRARCPVAALPIGAQRRHIGQRQRADHGPGVVSPTRLRSARHHHRRQLSTGTKRQVPFAAEADEIVLRAPRRVSTCAWTPSAGMTMTQRDRRVRTVRVDFDT